MIAFANTPWELFTLVTAFLLGLALVLRISQWLATPIYRGVTLYLWHSLFCLAYIWYSLNNPADSLKYFIDSLYWDSGPNLGGRSVVFLNSILTQNLGMSYGGCFFVFNIIGSIGLIAFSAAVREAVSGKSRIVRQVATAIPFLPGFSFWSAAIGKDSIAFFSTGLICWAAASPYRRLPAMALGFFAILAVRPHMAGFLAISMSIAYVLINGHAVKKLLLSSILAPAAAAVVILSISYVGLEGQVSVDGLTSFVDQRQSYNLAGGSSVDIANASVPMRMFMYVFRPLFFDASGIFGLVVSFENLVLLAIILGGLYGALKRDSNLSKFQHIFFIVYVLICWLALANTTANLGIAIRQKTMFIPMLIMLLFSYFPNTRYVAQEQFFLRQRRRFSQPIA